MVGLIGVLVTSTSVTPLVPVANLAASATEFTRERNPPGVHLSSIKSNQQQVLHMSICLGFHPIPLQSPGALAIGTPIKNRSEQRELLKRQSDYPFFLSAHTT